MTTNINSVEEIKHFTLQQLVDKFTALEDKQFLCMHLRFKKVIAKIINCLQTPGMA